MPTPRKIDRNEELVTLRESRFDEWSWAMLGARFEIHRQTARQIYLREKARTQKIDDSVSAS